MATTDKQKQSLYFPEEMLREIMREANRLDRSLSWTVQQAWRLARNEVGKLPSVEQLGRTTREPAAPPVRERPPQVVPARAEAEPPVESSQVREFLRGKFDRGP